MEHLSAGQLWAYLRAPGVYRCPSDPRAHYLRSYSISDTLAGSHEQPVARDRKLSQVRRASQRLTMIEENDLRGSNLGSFIIDALAPGWIDPPAGWHGSGKRGCNLSFADGHVEWFRFADARSAVILPQDNTYPPQVQPDNPDLRRLVVAYLGEQ
jgi:prepilin-type processing-associated H-X9-DG protein